MPGRVSEAEKLSHRFMVNCTAEQHRVVLDEAEQDGIQPGIVARRAFALGLAELRSKRGAVRRQTAYAKRQSNKEGG